MTDRGVKGVEGEGEKRRYRRDLRKGGVYKSGRLRGYAQQNWVTKGHEVHKWRLLEEPNTEAGTRRCRCQAKVPWIAYHASSFWSMKVMPYEVPIVGEDEKLGALWLMPAHGCLNPRIRPTAFATAGGLSVPVTRPSDFDCDHSLRSECLCCWAVFTFLPLW